MSEFQSKYPAFYALLVIFGMIVKDVEVPGETALEKLEGSISLVPVVLSFISSGQSALLGAEMTALKASAADIESGAELLVSELAFSSDKAKAIIPAAFGVGEWVVAGVPAIEALMTAIKS